MIIVLGIVGGMAGGLLGIGGGTIFVPALVILFGIEQHLAQGTAISVMVPMSLVGAYKYFRHENIDLKIAVFLILGALFGALAGALIAVNISTLLLKKIFGIFIIFVGIKMLLGK